MAVAPIEALLELLRRQEPVEAFEALLASVPAAEQDGVRRSVASALEVRSVLVERRRREAELAALYETAGDATPRTPPGSRRGPNMDLQAVTVRGSL